MTEQDLLAQPPADYMNETQRGFFRALLLAGELTGHP
jgi:DnaK suppressor protein